MKSEKTTRAFSEDIDCLIAGIHPAHNDPLLALAAEMSFGSALKPAPDFAQRLRRQLLSQFQPLSRRALIRPRWAWMAVVLCALLVGMIAILPIQRASTNKVLARSIDTLTINPGQIVYQVYTSQGVLYQEWQRMDITANNQINAIEKMTIRYTADDTLFTQPREWFYITPEKHCNLDHVRRNSPYPRQDATGCTTFDSAEQAPNPLAPFSGETMQQRLYRLQAHAENLSVAKATLDGRNVFSLTNTEINPQADIRAFTDTLYIDATTYLPAGYSYMIEPHSGPIYEWHTIVLDYTILNPADLAFDPFIWPPDRITE